MPSPIFQRRAILAASLLFATLALLGCASGATNAAGSGGAATVTRVSAPGGSYTNVSPAMLAQMLTKKDFLFVNVHVPYEGEIAQADLFLPYDQVASNLSKLPADKGAKIVLYCRSGSMSTTAAQTLVRLGYSNVWNLDGGMNGWKQAGLPVSSK